MTRKGRARLATARRAGVQLELPESPQHFKWRYERTNALAELAAHRAKVREAIKQATTLLKDDGSSADAWIEFAEKVEERCLRFAYAKHCVDDWAEPDETRPDPHELPRKLATAALSKPPKHG